MDEVAVLPVPLARLAAILPPERAEALEAAAARARAGFGDRVVWHVNATAQGGGVAEMLQTLLAYGRGGGVENRWLVLHAGPEFFAVTKRLHNLLHGNPGDGGPLGQRERATYDDTLAANLAELTTLVAPGDVVLLHDPQTAGLAPGLLAAGALVAWRCHVGRDRPDERTRQGWAFLRPYLADVPFLVFSRRAYAPDWVEPGRLAVVPPSIDPFSLKNMEMSREVVDAVLARVGLVTDGHREGPVDFVRRDGSTGSLRMHRLSRAVVPEGEPPPADAPLVVQVSRWDRLKDMAGVMAGFARALARDDLAGAHLVLAGPATTGVTDDPEGAEVLAECRESWAGLSPHVRERVHLASVPMDDADENAVVVNALQRHATVVVQKSLAEGFGLTVTEAMWKSRPVVASRVGGIQDQVVDGRDGLLLDDPRDPDELAAALRRVLGDPLLGARLGAAAHQRVLQEYVGDRHLERYVELFSRLVGPG